MTRDDADQRHPDAAGLARELLWLAPLYAAFSFIQLQLKLAVTPSWFDGTLASNHARLLAFDYTNNEQSRILQFYVPEALHRLLGIDVVDAYLLQRLVFVFAAFLVLHVYLRGWFDRVGAALCVSVEAAVMALSYRNDLQESAPLLLLLFTVCLWRIRERDDLGYALTLLLGAMVNETCLVLASVHFFFGAGALLERRGDFALLLRAALRTFLLTLPAFAYTLWIRSVTAGSEHLGGAWHLPDNLSGLARAVLANPLHWHEVGYIDPLLIFGPLWLYAFLSCREKPLFLRAASLMVPLFLGAHLLTGIIEESRQLLPLGAVILPMAFWSFARGSRQLEAR